MKLKKWLVVVCALVMLFTLAACGDKTTDAEPVKETQETPSATAPEDQLAEEQAKADEDYKQLTDLMTDVVAHEDKVTAFAALREQVTSGTATEAQLLEAFKQLSDDSQRLLKAVQDAQWKTEYYNEHVTLLTTTTEALAESELLSYEAVANNDESKLENVETLTNTYKESLDALFNLLGV